MLLCLLFHLNNHRNPVRDRRYVIPMKKIGKINLRELKELTKDYSITKSGGPCSKSSLFVEDGGWFVPWVTKKERKRKKEKEGKEKRGDGRGLGKERKEQEKDEFLRVARIEQGILWAPNECFVIKDLLSFMIELGIESWTDFPHPSALWSNDSILFQPLLSLLFFSFK